MHGQVGARENVAEAVMRYLRHQPDAADTLEGVVKWWLPRQRYLDTRERVEAALELLVQRELVEKFAGPGGVVYRCVRSRATRVARLSRH